MLTPPLAGASSTVQTESFENMLSAATAIGGVDDILSKFVDSTDIDVIFADVDPYGMATFMRGLMSIPGPYFVSVTELFGNVGITFTPTCSIALFLGSANVSDIQKMLRGCQAYGKQLRRNGTLLQHESQATSLA